MSSQISYMPSSPLRPDRAGKYKFHKIGNASLRDDLDAEWHPGFAGIFRSQRSSPRQGPDAEGTCPLLSFSRQEERPQPLRIWRGLSNPCGNGKKLDAPFDSNPCPKKRNKPCSVTKVHEHVEPRNWQNLDWMRMGERLQMTSNVATAVAYMPGESFLGEREGTGSGGDNWLHPCNGPKAQFQHLSAVGKPRPDRDERCP